MFFDLGGLSPAALDVGATCEQALGRYIGHACPSLMACIVAAALSRSDWLKGYFPWQGG